jgi:hypothetical protein
VLFKCVSKIGGEFSCPSARSRWRQRPKKIVHRRDRHQARENRPIFPRSAATFQSRLPPKRGKRPPMGAPPECSTVQMHWFEKRLFLKDFFAAVNQWRREWDSYPPCRDSPKTAVKQGFPKSPAKVCDHRCVPPDRPVRPSTSADFEASGGAFPGRPKSPTDRASATRFSD